MVLARTEPPPTAGAPVLSPTAGPPPGPNLMDRSPTEWERPAPPRTAPPRPARPPTARPPTGQPRTARPPTSQPRTGRARTDPRQAPHRRAVLLRAPLQQTAPARPGRRIRLPVDRSARPTTQPASFRRTLPPSTAVARSSATAATPAADQVTTGSLAATVDPAPPIPTSPAWLKPTPASPPATSRTPATRPAPTSLAPTAPDHPRNQPQPRPRTAPTPPPQAAPVAPAAPAAPAAGTVRATPATRATPLQPPPRYQRIRPAAQHRPVRSGHAGTGSTTCGR
ncbi:MAG: hypothetical protein QOG10_2980 [Kribbellaceae bacterium]|nr:hypothetical protein [Kribbellaceae bacterium]